MSQSIGADPGTVFFQVASKEKDAMKYKVVRNAFVELPQSEDSEEVLKRNGWQYVRDGNNYYVIGEDALRVANIFPGKVEVRRPMQDGVLNKDEDKKLIILNKIIEDSVGKAPDANSWLCTCISSESLDGSQNSIFHKQRLEAMFSRLGWNVKIIEEAQAVILSERPIMKEDGQDVPYSGIAMSFGGGRTNCVMSYRGLPVLGCSVAYGGDRIDKQVSEQTGIPISQVMSIKEKKLDFDKIDFDDDVLFALDAYYDNMMLNVFTHFAKKFSKEKTTFNAPIDVVVAGGTSMPNGFAKKLEKIIRKMDLPFKIGEVRSAKNPRTAVVEGLYIQAEVCRKKAEKGENLEKQG